MNDNLLLLHYKLLSREFYFRIFLRIYTYEYFAKRGSNVFLKFKTDDYTSRID